MIAGAGFAMMAWRLAQERSYSVANSYYKWPFRRLMKLPCGRMIGTGSKFRGVDWEYYSIIDRAEHFAAMPHVGCQYVTL